VDGRVVRSEERLDWTGTILAGPERSSAAIREFLDARLYGIDLKCRSQFDRVRNRDYRHALATVSLGKAALRSAATMLGADLAPDGIRVATLTIAGQIVAGTAFDPARIAERYWDLVQTDGPWQAEFRFTGD
jgi:hypothetical protein